MVGRFSLRGGSAGRRRQYRPARATCDGIPPGDLLWGPLAQALRRRRPSACRACPDLNSIVRRRGGAGFPALRVAVERANDDEHRLPRSALQPLLPRTRRPAGPPHRQRGAGVAVVAGVREVRRRRSPRGLEPRHRGRAAAVPGRQRTRSGPRPSTSAFAACSGTRCSGFASSFAPTASGCASSSRMRGRSRWRPPWRRPNRRALPVLRARRLSAARRAEHPGPERPLQPARLPVSTASGIAHDAVLPLRREEPWLKLNFVRFMLANERLCASPRAAPDAAQSATRCCPTCASPSPSGGRAPPVAARRRTRLGQAGGVVLVPACSCPATRNGACTRRLRRSGVSRLRRSAGASRRPWTRASSSSAIRWTAPTTACRGALAITVTWRAIAAPGGGMRQLDGRFQATTRGLPVICFGDSFTESPAVRRTARAGFADCLARALGDAATRA